MSEFEIQAELFIRLKDLGFNVKGEYKEGKNRYDIVLLNEENEIDLIIEVKKHKRPKKTKKQIDRYRETGRKVIGCWSMTFVPIIIRNLQNGDLDF